MAIAAPSISGQLPRATTIAAPAAGEHLYLHIPYCAAKCPYCDFNSVAGRDGEHGDYVEALLLEVARLPRGPYATVFIGGGTPSLLAPALLARLLAGLRAHLVLAPGYEWTCEANPGSADGERFALLAEHGVNRLSLGVQSTSDERLRFLGRVHGAAEAERALALARAAVPRVSADLIMGLPGQDAAELARDLALYRRHGLDHASVYHLAYEAGTEFHARRARGELREIDPALSRALMAQAADTLAGLGLMRYETSNFARPGQESRHNLAYWTLRDYHAAGAGAVSTLLGERLTREPHSGRYLAAIRAGGDAAWKRETLDPAARLAETWMLGLRLARGVAIAELTARGDREPRWRPRADALIAAGVIEEVAGHLRLCADSWPAQDEATVYLMP
jgi:oxygen-independent coproporphyrinogen-3 oxidase